MLPPHFSGVVEMMCIIAKAFEKCISRFGLKRAADIAASRILVTPTIDHIALNSVFYERGFDRSWGVRIYPPSGASSDFPRFIGRRRLDFSGCDGGGTDSGKQEVPYDKKIYF